QPPRPADRRFPVRADAAQPACLQRAFPRRDLGHSDCGTYRRCADRRNRPMTPAARPPATAGRRWLLAAALLAVLAAGAAFALARGLALSESRTRLDQSLILTSRAVEAEIERFRALPGVAAEDARIRAAILDPGTPARIATANDYLARIAGMTGADQLYLLN